MSRAENSIVSTLAGDVIERRLKENKNRSSDNQVKEILQRMAFRPFGKDVGPSMSSKPSPFTPFGASAPTHTTRCAFSILFGCIYATIGLSFQFLRFLNIGITLWIYSALDLSSCQIYICAMVVLKCLGSSECEKVFLNFL